MMTSKEVEAYFHVRKARQILNEDKNPSRVADDWADHMLTAVQLVGTDRVEELARIEPVELSGS